MRTALSRRPLHTPPWPRSRGQALVEFALVLPVLTVMLLTVVDLGRLFYSQMAITNAAREGALQASLPADPGPGQPGGTFDPNHAWYTAGTTCDSTTDAVTCRALLEFQGTPANWFVQPTPGDVTASCLASGTTPPCASGIGNNEAVTVQTTFSLWSPWMGAFFGGHQTVPLSATATSQVETIPTGAPTPVSDTSGNIKVMKNAVGGDGTFQFTGTGSSQLSSFSVATNAGYGSAVFTGLPTGTYTISELATSGWAPTSLNCVTSGVNGSSSTVAGGSGSQGTATINLKVGDTVICSFTNTLSTVCSAPSAAFNASYEGGSAGSGSSAGLTVPNGTTVTFDPSASSSSLSCPIQTWTWNFGDISPVVVVNSGAPQQHTFYAHKNPSGNYNQDGTYQVQLVVSNSAGSSTAAALTVTATKP